MDDTQNPSMAGFSLYADIACVGSYSSVTCDFEPQLRLPDHDFASSVMPPAVLERFIEHYSAAQIHSDIHYYWRGGDPLLVGIPYMEHAVRLQQRYADGVPIHNSLHTPGMRINEPWCAFFASHGFEVSLELDGPPSVHEAYRHTEAAHVSMGRCTRRTVESLSLLRDYGVPHHVVVHVHDRNVRHPLETYQYLRAQGIQHMDFQPVVTWDARGQVRGHSVRAEDYGAFLISLFDHWIRHDAGKVRISNFERTLHHDRRPHCTFATTCGHHAYCAPTGDIYACRHFTKPEDRLGVLGSETFAGLLYGRKQLRFGAGKESSLTRQCRACDFLDYCGGGCQRYRRALSESGQKGHSYLCAAYRSYFAHVLTPLKYLAAELNRGHGAERMCGYYHRPDEDLRY
jgi:uncharacterized protein